MKKHLFLSLTLVSAGSMFAAEVKNGKASGDDVFDQTFFLERPEFLSARPEKTTMFRDRALARCDGRGGAFQFVPFGGQSTKSKDLMQYFAPCPKEELSVNNGNPLTRDINPVHFGIQGNYSSTLLWRPRRSVGGLGITYKQYLGRDCDPACRKWWLEVSGPILHVRNKVRIEENNVQADANTTGPGNITDQNAQRVVAALTGEQNILLTGTNFSFGRINDESKDGMSRTGAVIELKVGYDYYDDECVSFGGYFGLHIPGAKKPNEHYVFAANPGFSQQFGFMTGFLGGAEIWRDCDRSLSIEVETNHRYFVQNTQTRSFNIKGRKWSRYMLVVDTSDLVTNNGDQTNQYAVVPGINVFQGRMKVHPRYSFNINSGLVYDNDCGFRGEIGYNFYTRQAERVRLKDEEWNENRYAIAGLSTLATANNRTVTSSVNRISNIADNAEGEDLSVANGNGNVVTDQLIKLQDLGLESAAAPCTLTNLIYGSLGYHWDDRCYPLFVGLGGSYEISGRNTGLNRWLVWGKFGVSI